MRKFKIILLDAFKPSYLEHAPYLRSLTQKNKWGELNMGLGHWRGVEILFRGKSDNIAIFYKNKKTLRYLNGFRWLEFFGKPGRFLIDVLFNLPRWFRGYEMFRTGKIPLKILSKMDTSVKKHVAKSLDIEFIYIPDLDIVGHQYGTRGGEIRTAIRNLDKKLSGMEFDFIFSDHGMTDIEKLIRVPRTTECFIDSDMARYWGNEDELDKIKEKLPMNEGKIIEWKDKRYGQLIFLANTGNLIYPNFWNEKPVKGMHNYDGLDKDMRAFYLFNSLGKRRDLEVEELHRILINEIKNERYNKNRK